MTPDALSSTLRLGETLDGHTRTNEHEASQTTHTGV